MKILAISSGKGGVGKTTITLNIARQLSLAGFRTLIIDFDIHNKGTTCLFMGKVSESTVQSIIGLMGQCTGFDEQAAQKHGELQEILDLGYKSKLFLIPAARPEEMVKWESLVCDIQIIKNFFRTFIHAVAEKNEIDVVLIDCYGGVDTLTISAAGVSDDFIVVNEPDVITFAGTLLLYKQLESTYGASKQLPRVHFVINRVSGRFSFRFLQQEYQRHLSQLSVDRAVLAYLPFDKLVFDTFGDYPFFSELLPRGLYAKKIRELIRRLWPEPRFVVFAAGTARKRERIYKQIAENPFADPERIFQVWKTAPGWALLPATILLLLFNPPVDTITLFTLRATYYMCVVFLSIVIVVLTLFEPWQVTRWLLRKSNYEQSRTRLLAGFSIRRRLHGLWDGLLSLMPAVIGLVFFSTALLILLGADILTPPFRNLTIWRKEVGGLYPNGNYRKLKLGPGASIRSGTDLSGSELEEAGLSRTLFPSIKLERVNLARADLDHTKLMGDDLTSLRGSTSYMSTADLSASIGTNADFSFTDLSNASLWAANLSNATFDGADVRGADFRQSNLKQARFSRAIISEMTSFDGADLDGADFENADFSRINDYGKRQMLYQQLWYQGAKTPRSFLKGQRLRQPNKTVKSCSTKPPADSISGQTGWWWYWDKSGPAHLCDVIEPTIDEKMKELETADTKDNDKNPEATIMSADAQNICNGLRDTKDFELCGLLVSPSDRFGTKADLIELLLVRGTQEDLQTVALALQALKPKADPPAPGENSQEGVAKMLNVLFAIITSAGDEHERLDSWMRWRQSVTDRRLPLFWEWDTFNDSFCARSHTRQQNMKIRIIQLSALSDLTADQVKWWFAAK